MEQEEVYATSCDPPPAHLECTFLERSGLVMTNQGIAGDLATKSATIKWRLKRIFGKIAWAKIAAGHLRSLVTPGRRGETSQRSSTSGA